MSLITSCLLCDFFILICTLVAVAAFYIKHKYGYWKRKGVPQLDPTFPFGNYAKALPRGIGVGAITKQYYDEFKKRGCKLGGVYLGLDPYLVIADPLYAKDVLTKDFQYFTDRGIYINKKDPITVSIISQEGHEWRVTRAKFTNIFTSSKMKFFYDTLKKCSEDLRDNLKTLDEDTDVNIYEMIACYTTDVIGSVVFGVEANSFKQSDAIFRKMGRELFTEFSVKEQFFLFLTICYPDFARKIDLTNIQGHIQDFFMNFIREALEYREKNNICRSDLLQLLIEMKRSGVELTTDEMAAQAFLFFSAGFETSSASVTNTLFELALNQKFQDSVREEIYAVLKKHNGEVSYEALKEMPLLTQAFYETARKYPLLTTLNRVCVKDYTFENSDVTIQKGTGVILPVLGYHRDPDYFPDPLKWDPDRFEDRNEKHEGFFPFGDGPRNCIGGRFGLMQVRLGLVSVLRDYKVFLSPKTKVPLELDELTFVTKTVDTVYLRLKKI